MSKKFRIVFAVLLILSAAASLLIRVLPSNANVILIYQDSILHRTIELDDNSEPYTITEEFNGGFNVILIDGHQVSVVNADCPDGLCIKQGYLRGNNPIVCLPHRLLIRYQSAGITEPDTIG